MESKRAEEHQAAQEAIALSDRRKELRAEIQRKIDDPNVEASPWLASKAFTDAVKIATDPSVDDQRRHRAEIVLQARVALHTAWKLRQLEQLIASRADSTAIATSRQVTRATWAIAIATIVLAAATIGLIVATLMHKGSG